MTTSSPINRSEYKQQVTTLCNYLKDNLPTNFLIPLGTKNPLFKHAKGQWNWGRFDKEWKKIDTGVGILLKTLAVIDLDSPEEVDCWETQWPVLQSVPMETTSKGRHYFFLRTPLCDELGLTNGPLNTKADFKYITGTGTAGETHLQKKVRKVNVKNLYMQDSMCLHMLCARATTCIWHLIISANCIAIGRCKSWELQV